MGETLAAFGIRWELLLLQVVNFSVLLVLLWYFLYRPVLRILDERQKVVEKGVKDAQEAAQKKEEVERMRESILTEARQEGQTIVANAKEHAKEQAADIVADAQKRGETLVADAQKRAEQEHVAYLKKSKEEIAQAAILAAERILKKKRT